MLDNRAAAVNLLPKLMVQVALDENGQARAEGENAGYGQESHIIFHTSGCHW